MSEQAPRWALPMTDPPTWLVLRCPFAHPENNGGWSVSGQTELTAAAALVEHMRAVHPAYAALIKNLLNMTAP